MLREIDFLGIAFPSLLLALLLAMGTSWMLESALARVGVFRFVWYPPLFRISLNVLLFCLAGLLLFAR